MTNEQKLAAITQGVVGSYNLAPRTAAAAETAAFQGVARRAHEIAGVRGYFCRKVVFQDGADVVFAGLLVTVEKSHAPGMADIGPSEPQQRGAVGRSGAKGAGSIDRDAHGVPH